MDGSSGDGESRPEILARTRTSEYCRLPDGTLVQRVVLSDKQTLADARDNTEAFAKLAEGRKQALIVDMSVPYSTEPGVRAYYASEEAGRYIGALAMVTRSSSSRIIGNFFLSINNPGYPCRMFASTSAALEWLQSQAIA